MAIKYKHSVDIDGDLTFSAGRTVTIPNGTTAQRPGSAAVGMFRYNTTTNEFEGYTGSSPAWGAIAGSGGGSSASTVTRDTFSGNGSTTTFTLSQSVGDEKLTQVYVDGVYQSKLTYSISSGTSLVFSTAPGSGSNNIEVVSFSDVGATTANTMTSNVFTGTGSQTAFTLSTAPRGENFTFVYIQGVYQEKSTYSISGQTITFSTAPQSGYSIEVMSISAALDVTDVGVIAIDEFTANGSTTAYTLTFAPTSKNHTVVFVNGVYQEKATYSVSGSTLTFNSAPTNTHSIEIESRKQLPSSSIEHATMVSDTFTGNGSATTFTLSNGAPASEAFTMLFLQGVYQEKTTYSYNATTKVVTLTTAPASGSKLEVVSINSIFMGHSVSSVDGKVGAVSTNYDVSVVSSATTAVVNKLYVFTASLALTLPAGVVGESIKISNRSGTTTCTLVPNGSDKIMGSASTMTLDTAASSFELIFSGTAQGWVIIGQ